MKRCNHKYTRQAGTVESINGSTIQVRIRRNSACATCDAAKSCAMHEHKDTTIDIDCAPSIASRYKPGDKVLVEMPDNVGMKAVMIGFVAPLLSVLCVLGLVTAFGGDELCGGIAALATVVIYYTVVYMMRKRIENEFKAKLNVRSAEEEKMRRENVAKTSLLNKRL